MTASALSTAPALDPIADLLPKRRPWKLIVLLAGLTAAGGTLAWRQTHKPAPAAPYTTAAVTTGDVAETIQATGTLQPLLQVQVGSQVSGRIQALHADFNTAVHRGDLLAEIDPTPFRAAVNQAQAAVHSAEASVSRARADQTLQQRNLDRATDLRQRNLNAQSDLDTARASRDTSRAAVQVASAQLEQARAALASAQTNLDYTRIYAPIDGVVLTRSVDVGQTVAASLQAPVLFVIANDLTHMQVVANVDEADVGKLHDGLRAAAHVDAFASDTFNGTVREVRYGATTTSGVVTYPAVIDVANPDGRLRPGMTASITIETTRHTGVMRVPNAALRFRPETTAARAQGGARTGGAPRGANGANGGNGGNGANGGNAAANPNAINGRIYVLEQGAPVMIPVHVGISDGMYTEVSSPNLRQGMAVITDQTDAASGGASARPAGAGAGGARGGMGGGRGGRLL